MFWMDSIIDGLWLRHHSTLFVSLWTEKGRSCIVIKVCILLVFCLWFQVIYEVVACSFNTIKDYICLIMEEIQIEYIVVWTQSLFSRSFKDAIILSILNTWDYHNLYRSLNMLSFIFLDRILKNICNVL